MIVICSIDTDNWSHLPGDTVYLSSPYLVYLWFFGAWEVDQTLRG